MSFGTVEEVLSHPKVLVVGFVIDTVDKIMHGMQLGTAGMHNQVRQWAEQGFMQRLLNLLFDHGFGVVLTSDHGNIEAVGIGRPSEGAVADLRTCKNLTSRSEGCAQVASAPRKRGRIV